MFILLAALPLAAAEPEGSQAAADPRVDALEQQLAELQLQVELLQQQALLAEAEALAAQAPPPAPTPPSSPNAFNPSITAFGDVITTLAFEEGALHPGSGPWLRSLELDLRADVDPFAQAVAVLALHQEPPFHEEHEEHEEEGAEEEAHGHASFEVVPEEVYLDLVSLPAGFSARVGAFRQPFGISNRSHPHDLPWTDLPLAVQGLLGEEGYGDVGGVLAWRAPLRSTALTLQGGALRGSLLDPHDETAMPQWLGRGEWFHQAGPVDWGLGASATGLGSDTRLGADLMLRYRANSWRSVVLLSELIRSPDSLGGYGALQLQPTRALYVGARVDWLDEALQVGGYLSAYTSEFLRLRVGAMVGEHDVNAHLQLTFVWGSHPVEPYWVNR